MRAISELFDETVVIVPALEHRLTTGEVPLTGSNLRVRPLSMPAGQGLSRKLRLPMWLVRNSAALISETVRAGGIHAPVPGDVGTVGMLLALLFRKPLFVRHCGNWNVQRTLAEHFWRWSMERLAGGRTVMLVTGGSDAVPSRNPHIEWIFSTSVTSAELDAAPREYTPGTGPRLVITARQMRSKGTDQLIRALAILLPKYPDASLNVIGDGEALEYLRTIAADLSVSERVIFHGKLPQPEVMNVLRQSTLFCFPTQSEGFPKAVLEALAAGLPVITTRVSVLPHLIRSGGGVLLDNTDPATIANAVTACLEPQQYRRMSEFAIQTARQYSLERWRDTIGDRLSTAWGQLSEAV
jgi:glycosyltransferase involved in cell wall biosynthesis